MILMTPVNMIWDVNNIQIYIILHLGSESLGSERP